jgi:hypothetical protein
MSVFECVLVYLRTVDVLIATITPSGNYRRGKARKSKNKRSIKYLDSCDRLS